MMHPVPRIRRTCVECGAEFQVYAHVLKRKGSGNCCSKTCTIRRALRIRNERRPSSEQRFWAKVVRHGEEDCWQWDGSKNQDGYGRLGHNGSNAYGAHRLSYEIHHGPIPPGLLVCHHCDNPECTNPRHLFLGTNQDNASDKVRKGRSVRGEESKASKLTEVQVRELRSMPRLSRQERIRLGADWGVGEFTIALVQSGKHWKHIAAPNPLQKAQG
jgi:hypothetical protein